MELSSQLCIGFGRGRSKPPDLLMDLSGLGRSTSLVSLEHLNVNVPTWDTENETFWLRALGFALDSRADGICKTVQASGGSLKGLVWANAGLQQIHMPVGEPAPMDSQKPAGIVGLASADIIGLRATLRELSVNFSVVPLKDQNCNLSGVGPAALQVTSPTGVKMYVHGIREQSWLTPRGWLECETAREQGLCLQNTEPSLCMGMPYIRFHCPVGSTAGLARLYMYIFGTQCDCRKGPDGEECWVPIGAGQWLVYQETSAEIPYDGFHIAIYINQFVKAYNAAKSLNIVWNNPRFPNLKYDTETMALQNDEFRILNLVDPETGKVLLELEHEIRALSHTGFCAKAWLRSGS